jgi:hypothetical protein
MFWKPAGEVFGDEPFADRLASVKQTLSILDNHP